MKLRAPALVDTHDTAAANHWLQQALRRETDTTTGGGGGGVIPHGVMQMQHGHSTSAALQFSSHAVGLRLLPRDQGGGELTQQAGATLTKQQQQQQMEREKGGGSSNNGWLTVPVQPAESELNLLSLLGFHSQVSRAEARQQQAQLSLVNRNHAYSRQFPSLHNPYNNATNDEVLAYQHKMQRMRQMKDVAFLARGVTMSEVADQAADELLEDLLLSVAAGCEEMIDEYSHSLLESV